MQYDSLILYAVYLRNIYIRFFIFFFISVFPLRCFTQGVAVVPIPQSVEFTRGTFQPNGDTLYFYISSDPNQILRDQLEGMLASLSDHVSQTQQISEAQVVVATVTDSNISLDDERLGNEGYHLEVQPQKINIYAYQQAGVFYGVQTLAQLIRDPESEYIACMIIKDWPAFAYRGVMDDISRGPLSNMEFIKYQIRRLASLKINRMSFYIEHVVKTKKHPAFSPPDGISLEEWKELSDYAEKYHVKLTGSFQSLGHFRNILSHPLYAPLGVTDRMLFPGKPEAIDFLIDVYDDMIPAFSGPYFNINCDEAWDLGRGETQALADSVGNGAVYARHVNPLLNHVMAQGKRPMMWADMALSHPEVLSMIPKETIMLPWEYGKLDTFSYYIDPIREAGFDFIVCPGVLNSNRLMPDFHMATTNIREFVTEGYEKKAIGVLNTVWDDGGRHLFNRDWYGVAYGAEQSWNPNHRELAEYDARLSKGIYGDRDSHLPKLLHTLNQLESLAPTQEMNNQVMWQQLFPEMGESLEINVNGWESVNMILIQADSILRLMPEHHYQREKVYWELTLDQYKFLYESRNQVLKAAGWYREASIKRNEESPLLLDSCITTIRSLHDQFFMLKENFTDLWKSENREYWTDIALNAYEDKLETFQEVVTYLLEAKTGWINHRYLPPPRDIRMDIRATQGQYFSYWLITGPFEIQDDQGPHPDFLKLMGGETEARPFAGEYFDSPDGARLMWDKYQSRRLDQIDLMDYFSTTYRSVAYTYCRIESPNTQQVRATLGSNDGIVVYCNGEKVFEKYAKRSLIPDEDECMLPLTEGNNHILIKIDQWKGDWGFSFRLPDVTVRNHKYKYQIIPE